MKILITGITGFVGKNLIERINSHEICLIIHETKDITNDYKLIESKSNTFREEIIDFNPDMVIHLASYLTSHQDTKTLNKLLDANIIFGSRLLDALQDTDMKYFVNTGSFAEYIGDKLDPSYLYTATKIAFRQILDFYRKVNNFKVIQVVPYTIYGLNDTRKKIVDYVIDALDKDKPMDMTKGEQLLDFIYIDDVVDFYLKLIENIKTIKGDYNEYHLGTGIGTSIVEIANICEEISGKTANIKWGAMPYRARDVMKAIAPVEKMKEDLGWESNISIKNGLRSLIKK